MSRPSHRVAGAYRVTFSPEAWGLIGIMPSTTFRSLQLALERIASSRQAAGAAQAPMSATLEGLTVLYTLDEAERSLTVVDIVQEGSGQPSSGESETSTY